MGPPAVIFTWILSALVVSRLSVILHELGHAAIALQQTSQPVFVQVGATQDARRFSIGRLHLSLSLRGSGGICVARYDRAVSRSGRLKRALAGPAVNLVLTLLLGALALRSHGLLRAGCASSALTNGLMVVGNLTPRHARCGIARGHPNDGLQAWCLLRGRPIPAPPPPRTPRLARARPTGRPLGGTIGVTLGVVVLGALTLSHRIPAYGALVTLVVIFAFAAMGDIAAGGGRRRTATPGPAAPPQTVPMKTCPKCGALVQHRAKLCYCYHEFA